MRPAYRLAVILFLGALWATPGIAQKEPAQNEPAVAPKYDVATETTLKGNIDELKEETSAKGPSLHLMVKAGSEVTEVYLCPNAFLQEMAFNFAKGDQLQVVGSKVKVGEADVILAREITRGNETLTLRDKKGNPVWMPLKKG